jgi:hypothetical protein
MGIPKSLTVLSCSGHLVLDVLIHVHTINAEILDNTEEEEENITQKIKSEEFK